MSMTWYQCSCGCVDSKPGRCWNCGGRFSDEYTGGASKEEGAPNFIGDELRPHMDWSLGHVVRSKSERRKEYEARGLNIQSAAEMRRNRPTNAPKTNRVINYPGMKCRRSSAEKRTTPVETT